MAVDESTRTCKYCLIEKPAGAFRESNKRRCRDCLREWHRRYAQTHRAERAAYRRTLYWANPEHARELARSSYRRAGPERTARHRVAQGIRRRNRTEATKAKQREYWRRWRRETLKGRAYNVLRRAQETFKPEEFRKLCEKYGNVCLACGKPKKLEADHVVPLSRGGVGGIENIQPLCRSCNAS